MNHWKLIWKIRGRFYSSLVTRVFWICSCKRIAQFTWRSFLHMNWSVPKCNSLIIYCSVFMKPEEEEHTDSPWLSWMCKPQTDWDLCLRWHLIHSVHPYLNTHTSYPSSQLTKQWVLIQWGVVFSAVTFETRASEGMFNDATAFGERLVLHRQQIVSHRFTEENNSIMVTHHIIVQLLQYRRKLRFVGPSFIKKRRSLKHMMNYITLTWTTSL